MILNVGLPDMTRFEICRKLRALSSIGSSIMLQGDLPMGEFTATPQ